MAPERDASIMGLVLSYTRPRHRRPLRLFATNNPHPGPSQHATSPAVHHSKDETGMPTIAGCDDPILTESPLRYRMPAKSGHDNWRHVIARLQRGNEALTPLQ